MAQNPWPPPQQPRPPGAPWGAQPPFRPAAPPGAPSPYGFPPPAPYYPAGPWQPGRPGPYPILQGPVEPPGFQRRAPLRTRLMTQILMATSALALVYGLFTPMYYPTGHPWSSGVLLSQWTPHLLVGNSGVFESFWVYYFLATLASAVTALLAAGGLLGRRWSWLVATFTATQLLLGLLMLLMLIAVATDDRVSAGPAWFMTTAGALCAFLLAVVPTWRRGWLRRTET
ncbi:hypothetical protein M3G03_03645 [Aestuariimicrobium sp. p3-SID1156]|uniref:hypothetical protein n=1 Tax=Aestuariimicrobium sp. p3-SID1156 TaxID=2916038 RepID=UPI00223BA68F|nr:hypothetical protein [Aestuariimicrobium sp. p3-SID1156]MCT1458645.1 hypothetical protein [Aestuariimicrobium sp. p3-SID1156]